MVWLIWAVPLALAVLVLALLAAPVLVLATADTSARPPTTVRIGLLGGLVPPFAVTGGSGAAETRKKKAPRKKRDEAQRRGPRFRLVGADDVWRLARDFFRAVHIRRLVVDADFGTGDPADTGTLFGRLTPLIYGFGGSERVQIALRPDFGAERLDGRAEAVLSVVPLALLFPAARFAFALWRRDR